MENDMKLPAGEALIKENCNKDNSSCPLEQERGADASLRSDTHGEKIEGGESNQVVSHYSVRTPFASLSQFDADLALARTLQDQERAYLMIKMQNEGIDPRNWEDGNYLLDEEADFDKHIVASDESENEEDEDDDDDDDDQNLATHVCDAQYSASDDDDSDVRDAQGSAGARDLNVDLDPGVFSSDESYARALQDVEEREMTARMLAMAAISDGETGNPENTDDNSQDAWEEVDPDELSYEELLALGEIVGTEGKGLSAAKIASLPSINYKKGHVENESCDSCVICRLDYEDAEALTLLLCRHSYHSDCINNWLKINKVCPVCSAEVSTSGSS